MAWAELGLRAPRPGGGVGTWELLYHVGGQAFGKLAHGHVAPGSSDAVGRSTATVKSPRTKPRAPATPGMVISHRHREGHSDGGSAETAAGRWVVMLAVRVFLDGGAPVTTAGRW